MIQGRYFYPGSARCISARALLAGGTWRIETLDGALLTEAPSNKVAISARLGGLPRRLTFPDGGSFETLDNDGIDALVGALHHLRSGGWIDLLERSWKSVLAAIALAAAVAGAFIVWGIPLIARGLAHDTPDWVAVTISDQTLKLLDGEALKTTTLSTTDQAHAKAVFTRVAASGACGAHTCQLLFRDSPAIGANAFALPDGRVVMTDAMWQLFKNDDEIAGVFAHEMAHVRFAHGLQRVYQAAMIPAAVTVMTGDVSQVSQLAVYLPTILVQSAYSRDFERDADTASVNTVKALGGHPAAMANLLERLEKEHCGKKTCGPNWLGDHPETAQRAAMFRRGG